jgi:uncharacterized protein (PEP-CTERM system associated)
MGLVTVPPASPVRLVCILAAACLLGGRDVMAFPATDATNPPVTTTTNEAEPSESDLRHQLQLQTGFGAAAGGGWTFVPRVSLDEIYTDNVLNTERDRRWDLITIASPGFYLNGDVPNAQVTLSYAPGFQMDARTPQENRITQNLAGTGQFTIIPDAFYVDARAIAGGAPIGGGFGALGTGLTAPTLGPGFGGLGTAGLANRNTVQTTSYSISPYVLHRFGDIGTAKVGYQFNLSSFTQGTSYVPLLFPTGNNASTSIINEGVAQFETGERFAPFRDLVAADARLGSGNGINTNSSQYTLVNRLGYLVNHDLTVYGELGYESLNFNGVPPTRINDAIWGVGATYTPNPDSTITVSFGHQNGENNVGFSGSYALSSRTQLSASYRTGLQTDLQGIAGQLDLAALDSTGRTIDAQTGAPLFIGTGGIGVQSGLFRVKAFTFAATTVLDRDQFSLSFQLTQTTTVAAAPPGTFIPFGVPAPPVGSTSNARTAYFTWTHQFSADLTLSSTVSYGTSHITPTGNQTSLAATIAMQYLISQTLAANVRYAYFDRTSSTPGQAFYQNLVLVGISKSF